MSKNRLEIHSSLLSGAKVSLEQSNLKTVDFACVLNASCVCFSRILQVGLTGLEPVTLRLSSACSNQLSYRPMMSCVERRVYWRHGDSNPRPIACKATALPTELCPLWIRKLL